VPRLWFLAICGYARAWLENDHANSVTELRYDYDTAFFGSPLAAIIWEKSDSEI